MGAEEHQLKGLLESVSGRFSREQVRRILGIREHQLAAWERQGLVQPAHEKHRTEIPEQAAGQRCFAQMEPGEAVVAGQELALGSQSPESEQGHAKDCYYTFSDIVTLKTLLRLRRSGVPPARIRLADAAFKTKLGEVQKPWSELQIEGIGKNLFVRFQGATMEPVTGQLLLDYTHQDTLNQSQNPGSNPQLGVTPEGNTRIRLFERPGHPKQRSGLDKQTLAERFFAAGLRYEEGGRSIKKAILAYQKAIELNPNSVGAYINLGTIYYNLGQLDAAESCYQAALSIQPNYALVHFNLGNVFDERNELYKARQHYEDAVRYAPAYADSHYNLALIYEKLGLHGKARHQWLWYLKLDPNSEWASHARQQLEKTPLRLVTDSTVLPGTGAGSDREEA